LLQRDGQGGVEGIALQVQTWWWEWHFAACTSALHCHLRLWPIMLWQEPCLHRVGGQEAKQTMIVLTVAQVGMALCTFSGCSPVVLTVWFHHEAAPYHADTRHQPI
jgi:hypothetical protein